MDSTYSHRIGQADFLASQNSQLQLDELYSLLSPFKNLCITAYEEDIDPIQYFIFTKNNKTKLAIEKLIGDRKLIGRYEAGRVIIVVNLGSMISRKWVNDIFSRSTFNDKDIGVISHEDFLMLGLVYFLTRFVNGYAGGYVGCYAVRNIVSNFGNIVDKEALRKILCDYLKSSGYRLKLLEVKEDFIFTMIKTRCLSLCEMFKLSFIYIILKI